MTKIILSANTDWYLYNFRRSLARAIADAGYDLLLVSPIGRYVETLRADGLRWRELRLSRRGLNPLTDLATLLLYRAIYLREAPELVHHFTIKPAVYGSFAARFAQVPVVINSVTGLGYLFVNPGAGASILRRIGRQLYRLALADERSWTVFQNQRHAELFKAGRIIQSARYSVIPSSGVDLERFHPSPEPNGEPVALYAGRMLWDKGLGELVEAARQLRADGVRLKVLLVGDTDPGNPATVSRDQLQEWQEAGLVEWWGHRDDMPAVLSMCHMFVLPSYGEGISKSLLEAAAAGRPIVASDVPGCREVVHDGHSGLLVKPRDASALADALRRLASDSQLRTRMGKAARELVERDFGEQQINAATLQLYAARLREAGIHAAG